jgi:hypothetical protein
VLLLLLLLLLMRVWRQQLLLLLLLLAGRKLVEHVHEVGIICHQQIILHLPSGEECCKVGQATVNAVQLLLLLLLLVVSLEQHATNSSRCGCVQCSRVLHCNCSCCC